MDIVMKVPLTDQTWFNVTISIVVFANVIVIGLEQDLGPQDADAITDPIERLQARLGWYVLECIFILIFCGELGLRVKALGCGFFRDVWNLLDSFLVIVGLVDCLILQLSGGGGGKVRLLTTLRTLRALRLVRLVRVIPAFRELWLLVHGLVNSMKALGWVGCLLACLLYVCAVFVTTEIGQNTVLYEQGPSYDGLIWPYQAYFGTVPRSMFSLFQILTLDGWCDDIVRHVVHRQPYMAIFFIFYLLLTAFGLMNVVIGIIVENTLVAAQTAEGGVEQHVATRRQKALDELKMLLTLSDTDGSGTISRREILAAVQSPAVHETLKVLELPIDEVDELFDMIDIDKTGTIELEKFMKSCQEMVGGARQRDIVQVGLAVTTVSERLDCMDDKFSQMEDEVETLNKMTEDFLQNTIRMVTGAAAIDLGKVPSARSTNCPDSFRSSSVPAGARGGHGNSGPRLAALGDGAPHNMRALMYN